MKKYLICITIALSVLILGLFLYTLSLNSKIDTLNQTLAKVAVCDTKTMEELSGEQYKETFYLNQLNNSTTLIIGVIGVALVFAGFFSFKLIEEKFDVINQKYLDKESGLDSKILEIDQKNIFLFSEFKNHQENYLLTQCDVWDALGRIQLLKANDEALKQSVIGYTAYTFLALENSLKRFKCYSVDIFSNYESTAKIKTAIKEDIIDQINMIELQLKTFEDVEFVASELLKEQIDKVSYEVIRVIDDPGVKSALLYVLARFDKK